MDNLDPYEPSFWERTNASRWGAYLASHEERMLKVAEQLSKRPGARVLDIGCGEGRWSGPLLRSGWRATCLDIDPVALAKCQARNPGAECIQVVPDATSLPVPDASVDLIMSVEVPRILDQEWFVAEARRILRPGGIIAGVFYNRDSVRGFYRYAADRARRQRSFYWIGFPQWRALLRSAHIDVVKAEGLCWFPFSRMSNSPLIPACAKLEKALGLSRLTRFSPWVLFVARYAGAANI
jgi:SAM-dependent methyltransferase